MSYYLLITVSLRLYQYYIVSLSKPCEALGSSHGRLSDTRLTLPHKCEATVFRRGTTNSKDLRSLSERNT